ncbi:hypothetical protein MR772_09025 [bacterium]|nr:hypothetical protein [bacterium]
MIELPVTLTSTGGAVSFAYPVPLGYTKNKGVYRLLVTAEGEWEGLTIRCFWHLPGVADPASSLVQDGAVDVPASVTAHPGNGCITFEGSDGKKTVTSADLRYRVGSNSGTEDGTMPEPGTPAWEQLVSETKANADAAEQAKNDAQAAAEGVKTAAAKAEEAAERSAQAGIAASNAADDAAGSAVAAGNAASAAAGSESAAAKSAQAALESKTAAATSEENAAASAKKAQDVADSLPADYVAAVNEIAALKTNKADKLDLEAVQKQIGNLDDLTTKAKETLVAAINEAARTGSGGAGSITMRTDGGYIQYSTDDGSTWENLIALDELKGEPGQNGADGYSPTASVEQSADGAKITITDKSGTTEAVVKNGKDGANGRDGADGQPGRDGTDGAPGRDGVDGQPGKDGTDGITPTIGDNGNWFLGATDTGKPSRGATGAQGPAGIDGKTAYQYAVDGGYTGTEEEFAAKMAQEMPTTLPNPNALTFTGAVTGSYDGSEPLSVEIPSGGGGSGEAISWRLIRTINIVSGTSSYSFNTDNNGNAFKVKNFLILIDTYTAGGYLEIKPNSNFSFMQIAEGKRNYPFSFMMKRATDGRYILEDSLTNNSIFERKISKEYSSFEEFTSFDFWFAGAPTSDTTMYVLVEDV